RFSISKRLDLVYGLDAATQENSSLTDSTETAFVFSGLAAFRLKFSKRFAMSLRGDIYNDENGMLSGVITDSGGKFTGLKLWSVTLGFEYRPIDNAFFRVEGRYLSADPKQKIFKDNSNTRIETTANIGVWF